MTFTEKKIKDFREKFYEGFNPNTHDQCYILGQDECIELEAFIRKTIAEAEREGIIFTLKLMIEEASKRANISKIEFLKQKLKELEQK